MTGRVDIIWRILERISKKLKLKAQDAKKTQIFKVIIWIYPKQRFPVLWLHLKFFSKHTPNYIVPSGHFVFYETLCSRTSPRRCSRCYSGGWIKMYLLQNLYINTKGTITEKLGWLLYKWRIYFTFWKTKQEL